MRSLSPGSRAFPRPRFRPLLHEARDGTLWVGTWGGGIVPGPRWTGRVYLLEERPHERPDLEPRVGQGRERLDRDVGRRSEPPRRREVPSARSARRAFERQHQGRPPDARRRPLDRDGRRRVEPLRERRGHDDPRRRRLQDRRDLLARPRAPTAPSSWAPTPRRLPRDGTPRHIARSRGRASVGGRPRDPRDAGRNHLDRDLRRRLSTLSGTAGGRLSGWRRASATASSVSSRTGPERSGSPLTTGSSRGREDGSCIGRRRTASRTIASSPCTRTSTELSGSATRPA